MPDGDPMRASISVALLLTMVAGCKGSEGSQADPPAGPINYPLVSARLRAPPAAPEPAGSAGDLGLVPPPGNAAADGVIASFVAEASPVIGPINAVAKIISSWSTASKIAQLTQELAAQQAEINDIESELNLADNVFYAFVQTVEQGFAAVWIALYDDSFNAIQGTDGAYLAFLGTLGVPSSTGQWPTGMTYQSLATSPKVMNDLNTVAIANVTSYMQHLQDLSTAVVPLDCADCYRTVTAAVLTTGTSVGSNTSATLQLYDALYQQLRAALPQNNGKATSNLAPLMEAYNQEIMSIYQQNVTALQEAYTIEAVQNYLNYVNGQTSGGNLQIGAAEGSPSLLYSYGGGSAQAEQQALADAQEQVAYLYAARINVLFGSTMKYIVSDPPFASYPWPAAPQFTNTPKTSFTAQQLQDINAYVAAHPYADFVKLNKSAQGITGTIGQVMPTVNQDPYVFYQYDGINQFYGCENTLLQSGGPLTAETCPPLFPASTGAQWDGIHFSVYYGVNGSPVLAGVLDLVSASANVTDPLSLYSGTLATGQPATALLPTQINAGSISQGDASVVLSEIDLAGSTTNVKFTYSFSLENVIPGANQFWFQQSGNVQNIDMEQFSGVANQVSGPNGFVGAFFINWQYYKNHTLYHVGLACAAGDPYCWITMTGICLGAMNLVMVCNESMECTVQNTGSCGP